jgi:hypothetical protein
MGVLFDLVQEYGGDTGEEWKMPTFKDCAAVEIDSTFFNGDEHADKHLVDGKEMLVIIDEEDLRKHKAHWEAGAKQNFDTGLYTAHTILFVKVSEYGLKPKVGKELVLDGGTDHQRTFSIKLCEEDAGVYRMTLERTRQ